MTDTDRAAATEGVLFAFQLAHPRPAPRDVAEWIRRHPDLEADLMEHAALLIEVAQGGDEAAPLDECQVARGQSRALEALYQAEQLLGHDAVPATFEGLMAGAGKTVPSLARELGIGRGVLTDLVSGRMSPPIGGRLAAALRQALGATAAAVSAAVEAALASPRMGHAKAGGAPLARRRTYDEVIAADGTMSDERKAHWLGED